MLLQISSGLLLETRNLVLNKFVIATGAYPDFLPRSTRQGRVCAFL
jgi:hypothetical protein